jgi:hypothetical protein
MLVGVMLAEVDESFMANPKIVLVLSTRRQCRAC